MAISEKLNTEKPFPTARLGPKLWVSERTMTTFAIGHWSGVKLASLAEDSALAHHLLMFHVFLSHPNKEHLAIGQKPVPPQ